MRNIIVLLFVLTNFATIAVAQDSLQVQPRPGVPGQHETPGDGEKKEDRIAIPISDIPEKMMSTLDGNEKFKGWQDGQVYFDRSADQYLVHVVEQNATRTYRFDKNGVEILSGESGVKQEEGRN